MKYIRTDDGIYNIKENGGIFTITKIYEATRYANGKLHQEGDRLVRIQGEDYKITNDNVADTIEELCDGYIYKEKGVVKYIYLGKDNYALKELKCLLLDNPVGEIVLFIETDKGLIYVAKMNEEGESKLL